MWWARWSLWVVASAALTSLVVGNAFYQKKQFYPTVVYITKSKPSMAVVYAQALLFVVLMAKFFRKVFFGQLRTAEFEHLVERSWYAVTETCLAFTVFRDDFSPKFLALFTLLLFLKSFHWLAEDRVDYMERSPVITGVFHVRVLSLLTLLLVLDAYFVNVAYQSTITKGASVQLVFGFEYAILATIVMNTFAKYIFHLIDMQNDTPWENKAVYVLHTEVVIGLFKVILYLIFVIIMVRIYTLPLFALRPTYLALRSFKKALNDVIMSRRAINNMNNLYPDVTREELAATDNVCIICREEMTGGAKRLPCNHIFHVSCLRSWFQRQQTCPTCRLNVLRVPPPTTAAGARNENNAPPPGFNQFQGQAPFFRQDGAGVAPHFNMWGGIPPWAQAQQPNEGDNLGGQNLPNQQNGGGPGLPDGGPSASDANRNGNDRRSTDPNAQYQQFAFPPMPYIPLIPPPPPLIQTTGLTDDELRRMEGNTREHIEARLQALRNIQILLDSAVVQMQQYAIVSSSLSPEPQPEPTASSSNANQTEMEEPKPGPSHANANNSRSTPSREHSPEASTSTSTSHSNDEQNASSSSVDELRKRRLQRFSNNAAAQ